MMAHPDEAHDRSGDVEAACLYFPGKRYEAWELEDPTGGDGEHLFGEEHVEHPPDLRCGFTVDPGHLAASACMGRHMVEPCFNMLKQRRSPGQGVNALSVPMFSPDNNR